MERTLILAKPDAYARGLSGEILARFERKGLVPVALRVLTMTRELAERHYAEHLEKPFFGELADFITSGPLVAMVLEGPDGGRRGAPGDRRDQPARAPRPARSAATSRSRPARTSSTDPTVPSRPRGRSGSSSPSCEARPRLALAPAAGDPARRSGVRFTRPPAPVRGGRRRATRRRSRSRTRWARRSSVARRDGEVVLGVDTVVALDGRIYGKPADEAQARATLEALSGATHTVFSGVALVGPSGEPRTAVAATAVSFRALDRATIDWYLATGEWRGRAGGYAIQGAGAALVLAIDGDWTNVIGLPVGDAARAACRRCCAASATTAVSAPDPRSIAALMLGTPRARR